MGVKFLLRGRLIFFMKLIADFHLHSKYSRATSRDMDLEHLALAAQRKGINIIGSGDFTHPEWFHELTSKLEPAEEGLYKLKNKDDGLKNQVRFIITTEISNIYQRGGKTRRVHNVIVLPSLESAEKINNALSWQGNLKSDGRPILGMDSEELLKIVFQTEPKAMFIPAHCLLPDTYIHIDKGIKQIKNIKKGDIIYTHQGRLKEVIRILKRFYSGQVFTIRPFYFRLGLATTPEHPYLVLRNNRYQGKSNYYGEQLKRDYFKFKKPTWIEAAKVKVGDILLFPRFNKEIEDKKTIRLDGILNPIAIKYRENKIAPLGSRANWLPNTIKIDKDFCRLVGYYLAEGYTNSRDAIGFCFRDNEKEYIEDLQILMRKIFGLQPSRICKKEGCHGIEIIYFSKILVNAFEHLFYVSPEIKGAYTKAMPHWMLKLSLEKQVEIFRGWWRGDTGYTSSRELMNQMKIILLRLGIIPSIYKQSKENFNKKHVHKWKINGRTIQAQYDSFSFRNLSFFEDKFQLLKTPEFKRFNYKTIRRNGWIDKNYIYLPVREIEKKFYEGEVYNLEVEEDNSYVTEFATVHNCWTPWFAVFGSMSGFDSLEEAFGENTKYLSALETGLSSDPPMNWRISSLDRFALVSNSDAHSPNNIGREANVFDIDFNYSSLREAIIKKDKTKFLYTIEFFPEEGKYHYDGHRLCKVRMSPEERKKVKGICPVCGKSLTVGVLSRVEELADRPKEEVPANAIPFKSLVPLKEIIAGALNCQVKTKAVEEEYQKLISQFPNELHILLEANDQDLQRATTPKIAEGIMRIREGKVILEPGYDGEYGKVKAFSDEELKDLAAQEELF